MKAIVCMLALAGIVPMAQAAEYGRVISVDEIVKQVPVNHQVCRDETVTSGGDRSVAGAVIGGVAGGVLGHGVGRGGGKAAATAIGAITGAIVGDRIDNRDNSPTTRQVERCHNETAYEDQVAGYRVVYEYAGQRYATRMAQDPGDRVALRISVVGGDGNEPVGYTEPRRRSDDEDGGYRRSTFRGRQF